MLLSVTWEPRDRAAPRRSRRQLPRQPRLDRGQELLRRHVRGAVRAPARQREVLGHDPVVLHGLQRGHLERVREAHHVGRGVELATLGEPTGPRKDRRDGVGGRLFALLVLAEVPGNGPVRGLALERLAVGRDQHRRHQPQRPETLRDDVALYVAVVVFQRQHKPAARLDHLGDHVVNQAVFVRDARGREARRVLAVVHLLEDVFESAVVRLENRVLGGQVQWQPLGQRHGERRVREPADRGVCVVHRERHARALEIVHLDGLRGRAVAGPENQLQRTGAGHGHVRRLVLVAVRVAADDDGLLPPGYEARDPRNYDGLAEHGAAEDVADGAVGGAPHVVEIELRDAGLVGRDGGALDAHAVLFDGERGVAGDLVAGAVT